MIVVQCGVSPDYFMDRMQWYEVEACLRGLERSERAAWERTRYVCYVTAQVQSRKRLKPSDVLRFEWDGERKGDTGMSNEDVERLKKKSAEVLESVFGKRRGD